MKYGWLVTIGILVALIAIPILLMPKNTEGLPGYAVQTEKIKEAYLFAKNSPDALDGVNCFCGCMQHLHSGRIHSKGIHDCFRNGDGFEMHGSQCDMCVNTALDVKTMSSQGKTKDEIKLFINEKYGPK